MIHWPKVLELRDEVGAEDFEEVVDLFLEEVDEKIAELGTPGRSLEHDLHFLKGSAMNLGFQEFSELCRIGEKTASKGTGDDVEIAPIVESYHASKTAFLSEFRKKLAG